MVVQWDQATTRVEEMQLKTYEQSNPSDSFAVPKWKLIEVMEVGIDHRYVCKRGFCSSKIEAYRGNGGGD